MGLIGLGISSFAVAKLWGSLSPKTFPSAIKIPDTNFTVSGTVIAGCAGALALCMLQKLTAPARERIEGAVFVTGADSGMGEVNLNYMFICY